MTAEKLSIQEFLDQDQKKDLLRLLTAGSVDDGKSTLIGRLMFDSKMLYEDQLASLERDSQRMGHAGEDIDYALLLDGLKAEREQGITIDVAYRYFSTAKRKFIIADTPGHEQYTRNMITGGSTANLAIILIDATKGVITQTRRHTYLASLLGIKHIVLAVNKMDLVKFDQKTFDSICADYINFVTKLNIPDVHCIPLSALKGDNVVNLSEKTPWYHGKSLLEFLETIHISSDRNFQDFRFPVQYVLRPDRDFRGFSGKVASGILKKGDQVMALPSKKKSTVKSIITYDGELDEAFPPQGITITLNDEIDISRGEMIVLPDNLPHVERHFEANLVWMDENKMDRSTQFHIKHTSNVTKARIDETRYKVDVNTLEKTSIDRLELNEIGRVTITTTKPLIFDAYQKNKNTGSFVLIDPITNNTCAVGMILDKVQPNSLPSHITDMDRATMRKGDSLISSEEREKQYNQTGQTIWITGLHGSGKRELAYILERELFKAGKIVTVFDGATVRAGLSHELDFTAADRAEHLRRVAHVCHMLNNQGIITICAFISPDKEIREQVAQIIGKERFTLAYTNESMEKCKQRQPDLYNLYEKGEITQLPGMDSDYEVPENADFTFNEDYSDSQIEKLVSHITNFTLKNR